MSYGLHSLEELIGSRVVCVGHDSSADEADWFEADCLGVDGSMIKLRDDSGAAGWFSLPSFFCVRKAGPNPAEKREMGAFGLTPEDFEPGSFQG